MLPNMKKSVFVIDEHFSSKYNGVGTFISTILPCIKDLNMELNLISFNETVHDFTIETLEDYTIYKIPFYQGTFLENSIPALSILKLYINDSKDNAFIVSHFPSHHFLRTLKKVFPKSQRITIIHDQGWTTPLLGNSKLYKELLKKKPRQISAELQKTIRKYEQTEQKMYRLSDHIVCLSPSTFELLQDVYQVTTEKISLIPNGIVSTEPKNNRAKIRKDLGIRTDEKVLLFAGRAVKAKGIFHLLDAFEKLWPDNRHTRLVIAGITGSLQEYCLHIPNSIAHVTFTGLISKEKLAKWYQAADIGILPSYTEQCSYTGLEMMASKLLIVTTNGNGLRDMFNDKCALIVKACENTMSEELTDTLKNALTLSTEERDRYVNEAYNRVKNIFSMERMRSGYSQMLNMVFNGK